MVPMHERSDPAQSGAGSLPCQIGIVADDLTGACDAAVAFATVCPEVRVHLENNVQPGQGVWAISTDTRDLDGSDAEARLTEIAERLPAHAALFKKVDSVFRGNTALEIAAFVRCFPKRLAVIAPAYPALGRRVLNGTLSVEEMSRVQQIPVAAWLHAHGCTTVSVSATTNPLALAEQMRSHLNEGTRALLCDAETDLHLSTIVRAVRSSHVTPLWVGSGGLAHAMAGEYVSLPQRDDEACRTGDSIFFIGSDHAATRGQVLHLQRLTGLPKTVCDGPAQVSAGGLLLSVPRGEAEAKVREALSQVKPDKIGCLFMTGGDTARLVCRALSIRSLRLCREFAPGVPLGIAEGGAFDGVPVVLKSGAFGARDLLRHVLEEFSRTETISA